MKPPLTALHDLEGKPSTVRHLSVASFGVAAILALGDAFTDAQVSSEMVLFWLVAAFAPKVVQRFAESRLPDPKPPST